MSSKRKSKRSGVSRTAARTTPDYSTLTELEKEEHGRAVGLLYDARHGEVDLPKLLRKHRLNARHARRYLGPNLLTVKGGKIMRVSRNDTLVREIFFPKDFGDVREPIRGSRAATKLSQFYLDRGELLGGDMSPDEFEYKWRGKLIDGREVFADAEAIFRMEDAGMFNMESLYSIVGPEK